MKRRDYLRNLALLTGSLCVSPFGFTMNTINNNNKTNTKMKGKTRSVHHIGIPVSNLEKSLEFYKDFAGGEVQFTQPMWGEGLSKGANVPNAKLRFSFLKINNTILELIEYERPKGEPFNRNNNDIGSIHIAFEVDDIDEIYNRLRGKGVEFNAEPYTFTEDDGAEAVVGATFAYLKDPDGIQLEIFEAAK